MLKRLIGIVVVALALASCDVSGLVPTEHMVFAKRVVAMVQARDDAGLQAVSHPSLWQNLTPDIRARMAAMFPNEPATSVTVSSWHSSFRNGFSDVSMVMSYKYPHADLQVTIGFQAAGAHNTLTQIYVLPVGTVVTSPSPQTQPQPQPQAEPPKQPDQQAPQDQPSQQQSDQQPQDDQQSDQGQTDQQSDDKTTTY